jgi:hypothetical protein
VQATGIVRVLDNDAAAVRVTFEGPALVVVEPADSTVMPSSLTGPAATIGTPLTLVLTVQPPRSVSFTLRGGDRLTTSAPNGVITFTPNTWNVPQTVSLFAVADRVAEPAVALATLTIAGVVPASGPDAFSAVLQTLPVSVVDNDVARVVVTRVGPTAPLGTSGAAAVCRSLLPALFSNDACLGRCAPAGSTTLRTTSPCDGTPCVCTQLDSPSQLAGFVVNEDGEVFEVIEVRAATPPAADVVVTLTSSTTTGRVTSGRVCEAPATEPTTWAQLALTLASPTGAQTVTQVRGWRNRTLCSGFFCLLVRVAP